jgi:hypothetical protein
MQNDKEDIRHHLFYGLRNGELLHISDVENGLKCGCVCPACEVTLIARNNGKIRTHHFAHKDNVECKYGAQTAIHIAAKQILERVRRFKIPALNIWVSKRIVPHNFIDKFEKKLSDEQFIDITDVKLEKRFHNYIPDVIVFSKGKPLIIEIAVTHFVDEQKLKKIKASKESAIEIDLSKSVHINSTKDLEQLIIDNVQKKKWLHNQYGLEKQQAFQKKYDDELQLLERKRQLEQEITGKQHQETLRKLQEREKWYKQYYREILHRKISDGTKVKHIQNCPAQVREFRGQFYANVDLDCEDCEYSRGDRDDGKHLICLYGYYNKAK